MWYIKNMKIIVTGGAGFLGSHLCDKLIEAGHQVICVDNLLTGSEGNITHLKNNPNFEFINHDISEALPGSLEADQIYHLASPASPNKDNPKSYMALSFETMLANTTGTWNLCQWASIKGVKFLFASTSEVYGNPREHPQKESYRGNVSTTGPRACYDEAKRFGETIVAEFVRKKDFDGRIVRIFNTYGPRMAEDGRVVIEFIKAALDRKPFPVFGDGKQTRSFCYVDDMVTGLIAAMDKGKRGEVYNLGNPDEFTIGDLANEIKGLTGATSEIEFVEPMPEDDPLQRCPDISKALKELDWEPRVGLVEGLKKYIDYLQENENH
ncbi:MAG: dTDP-glucose 4,6-dehydratase [Microgenomates group bacterium Gr01-1014_80]|nr:MAG: dTDP-glucose 4,6-dehydratase [Microgenomates group bacterium Gr01-1014_80]